MLQPGPEVPTGAGQAVLMPVAPWATQTKGAGMALAPNRRPGKDSREVSVRMSPLCPQVGESLMLHPRGGRTTNRQHREDAAYV